MPIILAVVAVVGGAIYAIYRLATASKRAAEALDEYNQSLNDSAEAIATAKQGIEEIKDITENGYIGYDSKGIVKETKSIQELANGVDELGNNISLTEEEYKGY